MSSARNCRAGGYFRQRPYSFVCRVGGAALAVALMVGSAAAFENATRSERTALHVRQLQSDLMVAALSCDMRTRYNRIVKKLQPQLVQHGQALTGLFQRTYGAKAERELNRFVTAMANEASSRSLSQGAAYCRNSAALFRQLESMDGASVGAFSARRYKGALPSKSQVEEASR